jgi:hypothetical protein
MNEKDSDHHHTASLSSFNYYLLSNFNYHLHPQLQLLSTLQLQLLSASPASTAIYLTTKQSLDIPLILSFQLYSSHSHSTTIFKMHPQTLLAILPAFCAFVAAAPAGK